MTALKWGFRKLATQTDLRTSTFPQTPFGCPYSVSESLNIISEFARPEQMPSKENKCRPRSFWKLARSTGRLSHYFGIVLDRRRFSPANGENSRPIVIVRVRQPKCTSYECLSIDHAKIGCLYSRLRKQRSRCKPDTYRKVRVLHRQILRPHRPRFV
jgi:hypothetical protein